MRRIGRGLAALLRGGAFLAGLALVLGFGGAFHPALDALSHFRAHLGLAALLLGLCGLALPAGRRGARSRLLCGALPALAGLAALVSVWPYLAARAPVPPPVEGERRYTLLQMNLLLSAEPEAALARIEALKPDFVTLQEATPEWRETLAGLSDYTFQSVCKRGNAWGNAAVLSRLRPLGPQLLCAPLDGFTGARFDLGGGRSLTVVSQHLSWPWPSDQWSRLRNLQPRLDGLTGPLLLGGDFNAAPWSAIVGRYARDARLEIVRGIGPSWLTPRLPKEWAARIGLPIDNVLHSPEVEVLSVETLAPTDSDHLPVLVTFRLRGGAS